jgi:hypothetical protein
MKIRTYLLVLVALEKNSSSALLQDCYYYRRRAPTESASLMTSYLVELLELGVHLTPDPPNLAVIKQTFPSKCPLITTCPLPLQIFRSS